MACGDRNNHPRPIFYSFCPGEAPKKVNLKRRHTRMWCSAPKRIKLLSIPRRVNQKYVPPTTEITGRKTRIVREIEVPRRIEQLAIPTVRSLVAAKTEYQRLTNKNQCLINRFDNMLKRSLFTVYSRLANAKLPLLREKPQKWTNAEWQAHNIWLNRRARHVKPVDFKRPIPFDQPFKRIRPDVLDSRVSERPWIQNYQRELAERTRVAREQRNLDSVETYVKPTALTGAISAYFDQYAEWLKGNATAARKAREVKLQALHPPPLEKPKKASEFVGKWPEIVVKLSAKPQWKIERDAKEAELIKAEIAAWERVSDRKNLKRKPPARILKLALATQEQKDQLEEKLKQKRKEREEIENAFKAKQVKELPKGSRVIELAKPIQHKMVSKFQFKRDEDKTPFNKYF